MVLKEFDHCKVNNMCNVIFSNCSNYILIVDNSRKQKYFQNYLKYAFKVMTQTDNLKYLLTSCIKILATPWF